MLFLKPDVEKKLRILFSLFVLLDLSLTASDLTLDLVVNVFRPKSI